MQGRSQLPKIQAADATNPVSAVVLEDARGPLSAAQSKALLGNLTSGSAQASALEHHLAAEEAITNTPINSGNKVQLLTDGPATYEAMRIAIISARDHINLETYIFDDDDVGRGFAAALIDEQRQGVQVNIIRDSAGTFRTPPEFFNSVHSGGSFGKKSRRSRNDAAAWRDTDLKLEGPVVAELQKLFVATWEKQQNLALPEKNYFPALKPMGTTLVRAIGSTPDEPYSQMYGALLSAIGHARASVYLTNAYFAPDPQLLAALEAAQRRGIDVRLILPSKTDSWLVFHAGRGYYARLLKAGVKIFELRTAVLHSKTALIDGV